MKRTIAYNSWFVGISMFMFGVLKFFAPFKTWYMAQIADSGLPGSAYWLGQAGEITVGLLFFYLMLSQNKMGQHSFYFLSQLANTIIVLMMAGAIYVHLNPHVPADVLPLKIKDPYIPSIFLVLCLINIYINGRRHYRQERQKNFS